MKKTQTTLRIFDVIRLVLEKPDGLSHTEIQRQLGMPKSTLSGMLQELVELELLDCSTEQKYYIGKSFIQLSAICVSQISLVREIGAVLDLLGARDSAATFHAGILNGTNMIYIYEGITKGLGSFFRPSISVLPAHACALGKALLALKTDDQIRALYSSYEFERFTEHTVAALDGLLEEIALVRKYGYATDKGELSPYVACMSVALPFADGMQAAVSMTVPVGRFVSEDPNEIHTILLGARKSITERLGVIER